MPSHINRIVFVLVLSLMATPFSISRAQDGRATAIKTVVIDAGHGGHDPGTVYGKIKEKDINLAVALSLGERIKAAYPDVKVLYTRTTDVFIPLAERSAKANRNKADLFISIHVNSTKGSTSARGTETFVMGVDKSRANMDLCRRENSVITLEDDYTTKYNGYDPNDPDSYIVFSLMQNANFDQSINMAALVQENFVNKGPITVNRGIKQAPLLVLWQSTMPAVLIELGFLSNSSDRKHLTDESSRDRMVDCIFSAFSAYKKACDPDSEPVVAAAPAPVKNEDPKAKSPAKAEEPKAKAPETPAVKETAPQTSAAKQSAGPCYRIQIFATSKALGPDSPQLEGLQDVDGELCDGLYKYRAGRYESYPEAVEALKRLRLRFPGAFIVRFGADGKVMK